MHTLLLSQEIHYLCSASPSFHFNSLLQFLLIRKEIPNLHSQDHTPVVNTLQVESSQRTSSKALQLNGPNWNGVGTASSTCGTDWNCYSLGKRRWRAGRVAQPEHWAARSWAVRWSWKSTARVFSVIHRLLLILPEIASSLSVISCCIPSVRELCSITSYFPSTIAVPPKTLAESPDDPPACLPPQTWFLHNSTFWNHKGGGGRRHTKIRSP